MDDQSLKLPESLDASPWPEKLLIQVDDVRSVAHYLETFICLKKALWAAACLSCSTCLEQGRV